MFSLTYNGKSFNQREDDQYVNVGQLCATHDKRFANWYSTAASKEYVGALSADTGITVSDLVVVSKGGNTEQGTWAHPLVAIEVARWISPEFGIWCNRHVKTLMETGSTSVSNQPALNIQALDWLYSLSERSATTAGFPKPLVAQLALTTCTRYAPPEFKHALEPLQQMLISATGTTSKLCTVTEIGMYLSISAIETNKRLIERGLQYKNPNKKSKKDPAYLLTKLGEEYGQFTQAAHASGTVYQQIRWYPEVVDVLS